METLREMFDPEFLLRNSVYISLLVGLVCPLVGVYLVVRRMIFMGIALPQVSSCGIAFAFALQGWGLLPHVHDSAEEHALALLGSVVFTLLAILVLTLLERRKGGTAEGRLGVLYVLAGAWSILLLVKNPFGEHGMLDLLKGEIITISDAQLRLTGGVFLVVVAPLVVFHKEFLLVSFDPEMAVTLKKGLRQWDGLLFSLVGLTVSISVLSVGPLVAFGFLIVPPLIAHQISRTMKQFMVMASVIGGVSAVIGFALAYTWDLPVGATDVALLGVLLMMTFCVRKAVGWLRGARAPARALSIMLLLVGAQAQGVSLIHPNGVAIGPDGALYVSDIGTHSIYRMDEGGLRVLAGRGKGGFSGDGGAAIDAQLNTPQKIAVDKDGNLYFADRRIIVCAKLIWKGASEPSPEIANPPAS